MPVKVIDKQTNMDRVIQEIHANVLDKQTAKQETICNWDFRTGQTSMIFLKISNEERLLWGRIIGFWILCECFWHAINKENYAVKMIAPQN